MPDGRNREPLPGGVASGVGSLPGTDIAEAVRLVFGELPDFPYLPELPARGPGAELLGRGTALLVDLPVQLYAGSWQIASRPGMDLRRSRDFLARDLDTLTELVSEHDGPVKIAACGPWTLAAGLHRQIGGTMLADPGAVADLAASLREGLAAYVADVAARMPRARVVLQLDEPSLPAVLAGTVPTESGLAAHRAVESETARETLASIVDYVDAPVVVHCCAPRVPVRLLREAGAHAVSMDLSLLDMDQPASLDPLGEALDSGFGLLAGVVPSVPAVATPPSERAAADLVATLWSRLGLSPDRRREQVVVTATCGLAGATEPYARQVLTACRQAARRVHD